MAQAGMHGIAQGGFSELGGGNFWQGFASGALGSLSAVGFGAVFPNFANKALGQIAFGSLSGGIGAELTGGEFWKGAIIGGTVAGLNHVMHNSLFQQKDPWDRNGDGKLQKREADKRYLQGNGAEITVNGNYIDLNGLTAADMTYDPKTGVYSLGTTDAFKILPYEVSSTYGGSNFKLVNGRWQMQSQDYHYNMRQWNSLENIGRNILTVLGNPTMTIRPSQMNSINGRVSVTGKTYYINIKY